jgi:hypothetical protein
MASRCTSRRRRRLLLKLHGDAVNPPGRASRRRGESMPPLLPSLLFLPFRASARKEWWLLPGATGGNPVRPVSRWIWRCGSRTERLRLLYCSSMQLEKQETKPLSATVYRPVSFTVTGVDSLRLLSRPLTRSSPLLKRPARPF